MQIFRDLSKLTLSDSLS